MINDSLIGGIIQTEFALHHETDHEKFYIFMVDVKANGKEDVIPVVASENIITNGCIGKKVKIKGRFCSFYKKTNFKIHLMMYVLAHELEFVDEENGLNSVSIEGAICKEPILRTTPEGNYVADVLIANCRDGELIDYIPCVAFGYDALFIAGMKVGAGLQVDGRIQSREYVKDNSINTINEIVVKEIGML